MYPFGPWSGELNRGTAVSFWSRKVQPDRHEQSDSLEVLDWPGLRRADLQTVLALTEASGCPFTEAVRRLEAGSCWAGLRSISVIATTGWVTDQPVWVGELNAWLVPPPEHAYVWDCRTRPECRGHGHYPNLLDGLCDLAARRGARTAWIAVEWSNWRSVAGVIRAGFRPLALVLVSRQAGRWKRQILPGHSASESPVATLGKAIQAWRSPNAQYLERLEASGRD
jgi:ribosomal protein S18 acetylase RimI-like enzyme